ncbi:hypothetical protein TNCV_3284501 [Trichonephila clavipes]|nr:hypothetical protein TNCV_3284501 [Trichonephila clavipes]
MVCGKKTMINVTAPLQNFLNVKTSRKYLVSEGGTPRRSDLSLETPWREDAEQLRYAPPHWSCSGYYGIERYWISLSHSNMGDLQQWWLLWRLILAGTTLHRSL